MGHWSTFGLVLLVLLAGCSTVQFGDPAPQDRPIIIDLTNDTNETYTIELWFAASPLQGVLVHEANRSDYYVEMGGVGIGGTKPYSATSLTFPDKATLYGRYTLDPGRTERWSLQEPYPDTVFVAVIYNGDNVIEWVETHCGAGEKVGFGVTVHDYGASGSSGCL